MKGGLMDKQEVRTLGKITVKNFTTLTEFSALMRASLFLAGRKEEAEENGFQIKVLQSRRGGTVVKLTESVK